MVEQALARYPGVLEAAVIGVPDPYRGENVRAYLLHRPDRQLTEADLDERCRPLLAGYEVPREYRFLDTLPRTPVGKIAENHRRRTRDVSAHRGCPASGRTGPG